MPQTPSSHAKMAEISAIVSRLLSHYWTELDHAAIRQAQLEDWIEDLAEFELGCIRDACVEWRRKPINRRPAPGEIRALCLETKRENRTAIAGPNVPKLDADAIRDWSRPDDEHDHRTWYQRRSDALADLKARYARAEAWRKANPDHLKPTPAQTARDLGAVATEMMSKPGELS